MKNSRFHIINIITVLMILGCGTKRDQNNSIQKVAVEVEKAVTGDITVVKTFSGTIEGARQSEIYATIPERVVEIPVAEGSFIKKGQPIILLDKNGVTSQYNQAYAVFKNAEDNYLKMQSLYDQRAISEMNFKSAKTSYEVAMANFNAAKATVELSSPINGIVTEIAVKLGQQVPLGMPIATVANTSKMRMTVYVGLNDIEKIKTGASAGININSRKAIKAKIVEKSRSADPETRLFSVELQLENPDNTLKPGMFAKASMVIENLKNVLTINNHALFSEEGINKVYVVRNDSAFSRTVELGPSDGQITQVVSGLSEGDEIVVVGKSALRDGTPVMLPEKDTENVSG
jgi:membrane fusion protein (multidrug efflux system)